LGNSFVIDVIYSTYLSNTVNYNRAIESTISAVFNEKCVVLVQTTGVSASGSGTSVIFSISAVSSASGQTMRQQFGAQFNGLVAVSAAKQTLVSALQSNGLPVTAAYYISDVGEEPTSDSTSTV